MKPRKIFHRFTSVDRVPSKASRSEEIQNALGEGQANSLHTHICMISESKDIGSSPLIAISGPRFDPANG